MKMRKILLKSLIVFGFLSCFFIETTYAQVPDLNIWVGKCFKLNYKISNLNFDGSKMKRENENFVGYLLISQWDADNKKLWGPLYSYDGEIGQWTFTYISLNILAGTDLNFLLWYVSPLMPDTDFFIGFSAQITGRMSKGELKSASFKSLGGFSWEVEEDSDPEYWAGGISIKGSLIDESKLPFIT
jgi:hypothetical protein